MYAMLHTHVNGYKKLCIAENVSNLASLKVGIISDIQLLNLIPWRSWSKYM